jgi:hypothetical protein
MDADRRQYPRFPVTIEVELYRSGRPMQVVRTEDLSNGGVRLILDDDDRPPLGAKVRVRVVGTLGEGESPPLVEALVVRHASDGVAVKFAESAAF